METSNINEELKQSLLERLKCIDTGELSKFHVVLLPDFFVDHFLMMNNFEEEFFRIQEIFKQSGGNVPGVSQRICQGGNAANTALALAKLGINAHLICRTDEFGLHLLRFFLGKHGVDLNSVKTDGQLAITTAMEFGEQHVNVMVGDTGSVSDFTYERLNENDLEKISSSDIVSVLNWTLNKNGSDLAKNVFRYAKKHDTKTFFDTGDPEHRKNEIPELIEQVLSDINLDILGINENELQHYNEGMNVQSDEDIVNSAISFKKKIHARLDLHTSNFACSIKHDHTIVPTLKSQKIFRATGAGDAWNAGNIFAELLNFKDEERLLFANSTAGCYISSPQPIHPNIEKITHFLRETV